PISNAMRPSRPWGCGGRAPGYWAAMSQENVKVVRRMYPEPFDYMPVFNDPDVLAAARGVLEDIAESDYETVWVPGQVPLTGADAGDPVRPSVDGFEAFVTAFRDWLSAWEAWVTTPTDFIEADEDRVL